MRALYIFLLAGCAVKCDDNNYFVVEMDDKDTKYEDTRRQFKVYWNVPTMQCKSKRIPFENLYEKYGILQNRNDSFRGEVISILYDPGLFPALLKNETSGKFKFRNGGVPQEGDIERHLTLFRTMLEQSIPDREFNGTGIIDFESWRPILRQNFGVLVPYKDISYELEKKLHWWWPTPWIQAQAKQRFEAAAREFMKKTLSLAKEMRPYAVWGYYGFPYCFNMANNNFKESCAEKVTEENDRLHWLWTESSALYPSVYSSKDLTSSQLAALIRGRVDEAIRVKTNAIVLPYFWFRYRDDGYFSEEDLKTALSALYKSNSSGFIIWGSSNDVNTVSKCAKLLDYLETIMGPAIAEYTKSTNRLRDKLSTITHDDTTPNLEPNDLKPILDPEYHWVPPENYTKDIQQYVEEEIKKRPGYNQSDDDDMAIFNETEKDTGDLEDHDVNVEFHIHDSTTTLGYENISNEASQYLKDSSSTDASYSNNLDVRLGTTSANDLNESEYTKADAENESRVINLIDDQSKSTDIESYITRDDTVKDESLFNLNTFSGDEDIELTTDANNRNIINNLNRAIMADDNSVSTSKEIAIRKYSAEDGTDAKGTYTSLASTTTTALYQVGSGSRELAHHKPYICLIFYIYSVAKCLCKVFGKCS